MKECDPHTTYGIALWCPHLLDCMHCSRSLVSHVLYFTAPQHTRRLYHNLKTTVMLCMYECAHY